MKARKEYYEKSKERINHERLDMSSVNKGFVKYKISKNSYKKNLPPLIKINSKAKQGESRSKPKALPDLDNTLVFSYNDLKPLDNQLTVSANNKALKENYTKNLGTKLVTYSKNHNVVSKSDRDQLINEIKEKYYSEINKGF